MTNVKKKIVSIAAAAAVMCMAAMPAAQMTGGLIPDISVSASAASKIGYMNTNGEYGTVSSYTAIKSTTKSLAKGWYVVSGNVTISGTLNVTDSANIILTDGSRLTVKGGISVAAGAKFSIFTQQEGSGTLLAGTTNGSNTTAASGVSGIGGRNAKIYIVGGNIYAKGGTNAYGIYGSSINVYWTNPTDSVYASSYSTNVQVRDTFVVKEKGAAYFNSAVSASALQNVTLQAANAVTNNMTELNDGAYAVFGSVKAADRIEVNGDVDLYLANGGKLNADRGISVLSGDTLNIYGNGGTLYAGTRNGTTSLAADNCAGIGTTDGYAAGDIIINSGIVYAAGGRNAAGIGGSSSSVRILGGNVTAKGGNNAAAIGSGYRDGGSAVEILGGNVSANAGVSGTGIGSGTYSSNSSIRLSYSSKQDTIFATSYTGSITFLKTLYTDKGEKATSRNIDGATLSSAVTAYTVSFEANNGEYIAPKTVAAGKTLNVIPYVTRAGYTFDGWYTDRNFRYRFNEDAPINQNMTLYAKWVGATVTVSFEANNGEYVAPKKITAGTIIPMLPYVVRDGYTFDGWYTDRALRYRFNDSAPITSDITLYAGWTRNVQKATLRFYIDGTFADSMTVNVGDTVGVLDFPIILDSDFYDGWYTDRACTRYAGLKYSVNGDATLYAKSVNSKVTVTFYSFGNYVSSRTLNAGDTLGACEQLTEPGYTFTGWYLDTGLRTAVDNYTRIYEDTNLYAGWEYNAPKTYAVRFYLDGELMDTQYVEEGECATNNRFVSAYDWYTGSNRLFSFSERIYMDYDLHATRPVAKTYTVNIYVDGTFVETQYVEEGDTIQAHSAYYTYDWTTGSGMTFFLSTPIYQDYDLYAASSVVQDDDDYYYGSTFGAGGVVAAVAAGAVALGGGFAAGMAVGKKKKKDE